MKPVVQYKAPKRKDGSLPKPKQQQLEEQRQAAASKQALVAGGVPGKGSGRKKRGAAEQEVAEDIWEGPGGAHLVHTVIL